VKLTVTGPGGNDNVTHSVTVSAAPVAPTAAFTATPTYLSVQFTNQSTGTAPLTYAWDFGDGGLSTLPSPSHTYAGAGTYPVKLTVTGPGGNNNVTHSVTVSAAPVAPIAAFTTSIHSGTAPLAVLFTDTSSNTPTAWSWSFKDVTGNTTQVVFSTIQNPVHTFDVGNYSVELNASNSAGYGISTQLTFINVTKRTNEMFTTGVYRPGVGFYLKMDNGSTWNPSIDVYLAWDNAVNDLPVAGDWNSDGSIETGVYRPGVGFYLKMDNGSTWNPSTDVYLAWDNAVNDLPVAGDWNSDGRTETGVYRPGVGFYLKMDGGGTWNPSTDVYLAWDNAAVDLPVANDWNSDGRTETGVYRPGVGFYLKMDGGGTWNPSTDVYLGWDNANGDLPIAVRGNVPSAAKPSIISIFPNDGTAGTLISITELTGTNFQSGASVTLMKSGSPNITAGNVIVRSPTLITCTVLPALDATPGSWDVVVTNPDGQYSVNTNMFIIHSAVTGITSISPTFIYTSSVYLPITVYGSNFQNVRSAKLTLIGHADIIAQITPISGAQMNCYFTIPVFSQGTWSLVLTNNDGTTSRLENAFTVLSNYVE
jgi:PKD repeat protein